MTDIMADSSYAKIALQKLAPVVEGFRFYSAGWLGDKPEDWTVMKVTGAQFREAKNGRNKGERTVLVKGTERTTYVTVEEMEKFENNPPKESPQ